MNFKVLMDDALPGHKVGDIVDLSESDGNSLAGWGIVEPAAQAETVTDPAAKTEPSVSTPPPPATKTEPPKTEIPPVDTTKAAETSTTETGKTEGKTADIGTDTGTDSKGKTAK